MNVCRDLQSLGVQLCVVVGWAGNSQNPSDLAAWNPPAGSGLKPFKPVLPEISRHFAHFGLNSRIPWSTNTFEEAKRWTLVSDPSNTCWNMAVRMPLIGMHWPTKNIVRETHLSRFLTSNHFETLSDWKFPEDLQKTGWKTKRIWLIRGWEVC